MARSSSLYSMLGPRPTEPSGYQGKPRRAKAADKRGPGAPFDDASTNRAANTSTDSPSTTDVATESARTDFGARTRPPESVSTSNETLSSQNRVGAKANRRDSARSKRSARNVAEHEPFARGSARDKPNARDAAFDASETRDVARATAAAIVAVDASPASEVLRAPADRPRPSSQPLPPIDIARLKPLKVDGIAVKPCAFADLRSGDIGFVYQRSHRTRRQRLITFGERFINIFRRKRRGDAHIVHAFIVIKTRPDERKLLVADGAAGRKPFGINLMEMDFAHHDHVRPSAQYLFYRPTDASLASRIAQVACAWTYANKVSNFSVRKAIHSTWHSASLGQRAGKRALYFASQADNSGPLRQPDSRITYNMMCSEFVANVCIAATLSMWQQSRRAAGKKIDTALTGLWKGPAGDTFAIDGRGAPPSVLHARLAHSEAMHTVGYIPGTDPDA